MNHNSYIVYLKKKFVIVDLNISMFSIDNADNKDAIKQNGDKVEFSFNAMVYKWVYYHFNDVFIQFINFRILTDTASVMMEPAQPMSCSVSNTFEAENKAEINNTSVSSLNATFELSTQDISLVSYKICWKIVCGHLVHCEVCHIPYVTRGHVES